MPKEVTSLRLSPEALAAARKLSEDWRMPRTQVIERLLIEAAEQGKQLRITKEAR